MAIVSKFYTGSVDHVQWAKGAWEVGSRAYGVEGLADWQPVAVAGVDRTVRIGAGVAWGRGVRDTNDSPVDVSIPAVVGAAGTVRWDLIVARRTWGTSTTSVALVTGTAAKAIPAGRNVGPGVVDDQPLALVKVTSGSSTITELVDLRCFGGGGAGMQALDKLALSYLAFPGALVYVGTEVFVFPADGTDWIKIHNFDGIELFGAGGALAGSAAGWVSGKKPFFLQSGSEVRNSDASGYARITYPVAFPNGLLYVSGANGDQWATPGYNFPSAGRPDVWGSSGYGNRVDWVYAVEDSAGNRQGNKQHRVNWFAIGF